MSKGKNIMSRVRDHMEQAGATVQGVAEKTGLSPQTIMRARGHRVGSCTLNTLAIIAGALGVRAKDLFEEE